ncbi:MAG: hypothetical protein JWM44_1537 [Bacilli bacterium]|nr:hypothetical protein [Bacilli bacterium]
MSMIDRPDNNHIIWYEGMCYQIFTHDDRGYMFHIPDASGKSVIYVALHDHCQRNDQGDLNALEVQAVETNKWVGLLKVFDDKLASQWHSGSCTYYKAKVGFKTRKEAEGWIAHTIAQNYKNNTADYQFTPCVLNYDEDQSFNVEAFFKYM